MYKRTHPIKIIANLWHVFYLIIIPLIRGFLSALQKDFLSWLSGAWIDILVFVFMLLVAILQWYVLRYSLSGEHFTVQSGIIFRSRVVILRPNISTISVVAPFYLRPFGACLFRIDTPGGGHNRAELTIPLGQKEADSLAELLSPCKASARLSGSYIPKSRSIIFLSMLTSNSFAGIVFISAFLSQSAKLFGNGFSNYLLARFENFSRSLAFGIPPATAAIAYAALCGWLIGFLTTYISYCNFVLNLNDYTLSIYSGVLTKRHHIINYSKINYIDTRQTIASKLFGLYSLYISAAGSGKLKGDISFAIQAEKLNNFTAIKSHIFPTFLSSSPNIKAHGKSIFRFILLPVSFLFSLFILSVILIYLFPVWASFVLYTGLMLLIPSSLFLVIRIIAFRESGISKSENCYTICYSHGFDIHTVVFVIEKIASVKIRQSLFQVISKNGLCDVTVVTVGEKSKRHKCKSLKLEAVNALFL